MVCGVIGQEKLGLKLNSAQLGLSLATINQKDIKTINLLVKKGVYIVVCDGHGICL